MPGWDEFNFQHVVVTLSSYNDHSHVEHDSRLLTYR